MRTQVKQHRGVYFRESDYRRHHGKPDKCFHICYYFQGRNIWEKVGWASEGYTAALAGQVRAERIRSIRHGEEIPNKRRDPTLQDVWVQYDKLVVSGKGDKVSDRSRYQVHLKDRFGTTRLSRITPFALERLKVELAKENLAPGTVRQCLQLVRQMFNRASAWGMWRGENPVRKIKLPTVSNRRERYLTPEEARILLEALAVTSTDLHDIALMSLSTGMRSGEILNLQWQHIDLEHGLILVADSKSGRSRKISIQQGLKDMLLSRGPGERQKYLFHGRDGKKFPWLNREYYRTVEHLGFNKGITDRRQRVTFHTLRHTFASWLALEGVPIYTIKELLGHQTLAMTERYAHLSPDHRREATERIGKILDTMPAHRMKAISSD